MEPWLIGAVGVVCGLAMAGFMAPSLTNWHLIRWDADSLDGPCRTLGLTLSTARATIPWGELVSSGRTASGYWYVESSTGHRIHWNAFYNGHGAFASAIVHYRPDLPLPKGVQEA